MLIEKKDLNGVKNKVLINPRYLISSGDSPVIVKVKTNLFKERIYLNFK